MSSGAQAPNLPQTVARPLGSVRLLTSSRSAPGAVIKVARRTALHVLRHDADCTVCMAIECRIAGNVRGVGCVPSRRSDRCTCQPRRASQDGKRAWCQVRPARRRVHGWATPTRSRPKRHIPAAQRVRSAPRCACGDGLSASSDAWLHLGSALLLERCGRTSPAARGAHVMRWAVRREKLGGWLSSARAGQRSPRGYIAK
jgi:hypothetical protein